MAEDRARAEGWGGSLAGVGGEAERKEARVARVGDGQKAGRRGGGVTRAPEAVSGLGFTVRETGRYRRLVTRELK